MKKNLPLRWLGALLLCSLTAFSQTSIVDIQRINTAGNSDASPLVGSTLTVDAVVTASAEADNLDRIFLQQEAENAWAGIMVTSASSDVIGLVVGEKVRVRGTVVEVGGMTALEDVELVEKLGTGTIIPLEVDPALFTNYSLAETEIYESMLLRLRNPMGDLRVVEVNADGPNNNFGEWRLGNDPNTPTEGCRVLTGRQTSTVFSSLNVSYVNNSRWESNNGRMKVPAIVVSTDSTFRSVSGIMIYGQGNMKLLPRNNADINDVPPTSLSGPGWEGLEASVSPNPARETAMLTFSLTEATQCSAYLLDGQGRQLRQLLFGQRLAAGTHQLPIAGLVGLPAGVYFLRLVSPTGHLSLRLLKR